MLNIVVIRGDGDRPGNDISDILLTEVASALERGRVELDEGALADEPVLECKLQEIKLGQLVEVDDSALGTWRGKVTGVSHRVEVDDNGNLSASTTVNLRKPR